MAWYQRHSDDQIQLISITEWQYWGSGPWFNIKMSSYQYRKSHCGDKTVVRSSYLHNGISYTGKMVSLYWIGTLVELLGISSALTHCALVKPYMASEILFNIGSGNPVMACCLMAPSLYLNKCWQILSEVLLHSPQGNFTGNGQYIYPWYEFWNDQFKVRATSPRGQWVDWLRPSDTYMHS